MTCEKCGSTDLVWVPDIHTLKYDVDDRAIVGGMRCGGCQHLWEVKIEMVDRPGGGICVTRGCTRRVVGDHMVLVGTDKVICAECLEQLMTVGFTRN